MIGDRFSPDFIERRRQECVSFQSLPRLSADLVPIYSLERFCQRIARHPKLSRTEVFQQFLESSEWVRSLPPPLSTPCPPLLTPSSTEQNVYKHKHSARASISSDSSDSHPAPSTSAGKVLDTLSDTLLNAFVKLKKPDERFVVLRAYLDSFEEGLTSLERLAGRSKTRLSDLSGDYEDLAVSVQGLGYLESGITDPLMRFERALVDFGGNVKDHSATASEVFLDHVHALLAYSHAFKAVLKLRDQKQLDFEELSHYLSTVVADRERLASGGGYGMGLGGYFKERLEQFKGGETDMSREAKIRRMDARIKEVRCFLSFPSSLFTSLASFSSIPLFPPPVYPRSFKTLSSPPRTPRTPSTIKSSPSKPSSARQSAMR